MDSLGGHYVDRQLAGHRFYLVGPHAGGVDDVMPSNLEPPPGLEAGCQYPGHRAVRCMEARHPHTRGDDGAVGGGGSRHGERVSGVIDSSVVVLNPPNQGVGRERRDLLESPFPAEVAMPRQRVATEFGEQIVESDSDPDVQSFPDAVAQRVEELHRRHQVRGESGQ